MTSRSFTRKKHRRVKWAAGFLIAYTVIGFLLLPPIIRVVAEKELTKLLHREVSIQQIKLNPFAFTVTIRGLLIKEKDGAPFVSWDEVFVNFQLSSFLGRPWVFKEISTTRPLLHVQINRDGTFNFSDLLATTATNAPASTTPSPPRTVRIDHLNVSGAMLSLKREQPIAGVPIEPAPPVATPTNAIDGIQLLLGAVTNGVAALLNSTNAIAATVREVNVSNCTVTLDDLANPRPVRLNLDAISLAATNLSNVPLTNLTAALALRWNTNGVIKTEVNAALAPLTVDVHVAVNQLELHPLDPYLDSFLNVFIIGSKLGVNGNLRIRTAATGLPEIAFGGDAWLDEFNTVDGLLGEDLLKWSSVRISGINATLNPPDVAIAGIAINDVYARLIIETNRTINLVAALRLPMDTNAAPETEAPPAPPQVAKKAFPAGDSLVATNALSGLPLKHVSIGTVTISNAAANFSDRSLTPNVNMAIQQINGTIAGLSSDQLQHADINLHARVDNVGPVEITGTINPFSPDQTNEIKITLSDVDLTPTSSYSVKFAGYRIAKGKLNLSLAYHLHGRNLKSENVLTLDQFTFGEKVDSPDATKLPVRLAIAVLKDRDGKIILDVPIEGSLDDPQFRLHKVIVHTLLNIITKVATSPFAVLGAVFGGKGEEISYQDFPPGSAELVPASREKLDVLIKGLYERPGLQLDISGSVAPIADRDGLRSVTLEKRLRTQKWLALRKADRAAQSPDQMTVAMEERADLVRKAYTDALTKGEIANTSTNSGGAAVPLPALYRAGGGEHGATALMRPGSATAVVATVAESKPGVTVTDPFEEALLNNIAVSDNEFAALATERAKVVRDYILQSGKVEAERLFVTENPSSGTKSEGGRVYLQLK